MWEVEYTEEMNMAKSFSVLRNTMSVSAKNESEKMYKAALAAMPLNELRHARGISQKMLAEVLNVQQPAIAKMEKRTDMYISTLRSHIEAMGVSLEIIAQFPEGTVKISNFSQL